MTRYLGVATDDMTGQLLREQLASQDIDSSGAARVGYDGETVEQALDKAKAFPSYTELRAYQGMAEVIHITNPGIEGFFSEVAAVSPIDNGGTRIVDAAGRAWDRIINGPARISWFEVSGDGSDETTKIQRSLDSSSGQILILDKGKTYGYTAIRVRAGTRIYSNSSIFKRVSPSISSGITIEASVFIDALYVSTPGGPAGDRGVRILGGGVDIGLISVIADAEGVYNSTNSAVDVGSNPAGTVLENIRVGFFYAENFSSGFTTTMVSGLSVGGAHAKRYRTAFYLRDTSNSNISNVICEILGNAVDGRPGENGLLIESLAYSGSSHNLEFSNWDVRDSGEHAYRLGGQLSIRNIWFNGCTATRPGSSILGGRTTSGEWHGGCGFKILGGNATTTEYHENVFFDSCGVIDCNLTYGSYPSGHGVNNFQPWLVVMAKNVQLTSCWTKAESQQYVARYGILATSSDGVFLDSCNFRAVALCPLRPYEEAPIVGFPGSDGPLLNFSVNGGLFEVLDTTPGNGLGLYMQTNANYNHKNWSINGATLKGGAGAIRIEPVSSGSYENIVFDFIFAGSNVNESTYTTPAVAGASYAMVKATAPWRALAGQPSGIDGSTWASPNDSRFRVKSGGAWRSELEYSFVLADDAATSIAPPEASTGFVLVTGDGTTTHLMAWYRATSSPASLKYQGAAATAVVNTALTGTTGTDGNVTVGIQNGAIFIENRNGAQNTFKVRFLA